MTAEHFCINSHDIRPGTRTTIDLPAGRLYTHTPMSIPVHVIRGKRDGPRLFVSAAIHGDEINGVEIIRRALQAPIRQIAANAGDEGSVIVGKLLEQKDTNYGFDAQKGEFTDLVKAGIIDPVKVVRTALQDAASVSSLLITTEAIITEAPQEDKGAAAGGDPMGGMGGMGGMPGMM